MAMIDVKSAVRIAVDYMHGLNEFLPTYELRLEETELSEDGGYWYITLSFPESIGVFEKRAFKIFKIDTETGQVLSMKVRMPAAA
jgi:hypothetical protein